jgi:hypothetical protein
MAAINAAPNARNIFRLRSAESFKKSARLSSASIEQYSGQTVPQAKCVNSSGCLAASRQSDERRVVMSVSTLRAIVAAIKVGNDSYGCRSTPRHPIVRLFEVKRLQRRHLRLIDFQLANEFDDGEPLWCHAFHTEEPNRRSNVRKEYAFVPMRRPIDLARRGIPMEAIVNRTLVLACLLLGACDGPEQRLQCSDQNLTGECRGLLKDCEAGAATVPPAGLSEIAARQKTACLSESYAARCNPSCQLSE